MTYLQSMPAQTLICLHLLKEADRKVRVRVQRSRVRRKVLIFFLIFHVCSVTGELVTDCPYFSGHVGSNSKGTEGMLNQSITLHLHPVSLSSGCHDTVAKKIHNSKTRLASCFIVIQCKGQITLVIAFTFCLTVNSHTSIKSIQEACSSLLLLLLLFTSEYKFTHYIICGKTTVLPIGSDC